MNETKRKPEKWFRICQIFEGKISLFETHQFGDPNNWYQTEVEAEKFIQEHFDDAQDGINPTNVEMILLVLPVYAIKFRRGIIDPSSANWLIGG